MRWEKFAAFLLVSLAATASADIATRYDLMGNRGTALFEAPNLTAVNVTASNLTRGSGLTTGTGNSAFYDSFVSRNWAGPQSNDFLTFTVTPASGHSVSLDNLVMGVLGENASRTLVLRSSLDNYSTNLGSVPFSLTAVNRTMTFATPLTFSSPVTFRLVTLGATDDGKRYALTSRAGTAGLVLNGTVAAVPEPSSMLLLALTGAVASATVIRKRRKRSPA